MFKQPLKISKKKPEVAPAIGEYDQSVGTIQASLQKKRERIISNYIVILFSFY